MRVIGTTGGLSNAPNTMVHAPGVMETSASLKGTCYVEITGQEAMKANERSREMSRTDGSARAMVPASTEVTDEAEQIVQRAAHTVTRNKSKRAR